MRAAVDESGAELRPRCMVNGHFTRHIECSDRGFQYGDGVFTTTPLQGGTAAFLNRHVARLANDAKRIGIPFPRDELLNDLSSLLEFAHDGILKIQVTRGCGGRGYRSPDPARPTRVLSVHPPVVLDSRHATQGVAVRFCRHHLACNELLAGIKHMNRLEQILARAEWSDPDIFEGLMLDVEGNLIEGTMSNVFVVRGGVLNTPILDRCGVEGVMRNLVLELAVQHGYPVNQGRIRPSELGGADEIFLTNSVIGVYPVRSVEGRSCAVGPLASALRQLIHRARDRE